jgi:hypothetical protein
MHGDWTNTNNSSAVLTAESMQKAWEAIRNAPMPEPHVHMFSARYYSDKRRRWLRCFECFEVVDRKKLG